MLQSNVRLSIIKSLIVDVISGARVQTNYLFHLFFFSSLQKQLMFSKTKSLKELQKYGWNMALFHLQVYLRVWCFFFSIIFAHWNIEKLYLFLSIAALCICFMCGLYEASHLKKYIFRWCKKYCKFIIT